MIPVFSVILAATTTAATTSCLAFLHSPPSIFRHGHHSSKPALSSKPSILCCSHPGATEIDAKSSPLDTRHDDLIHKVDNFIDEKLAAICAFCNSDNVEAREILTSVDRDHDKDVSWAKEALLPFEWDNPSGLDGSSSCRDAHPIEYDDILSANDATSDHLQPTTGGEARRIAIRTKQSTPLLQRHEIQCLKEAVELYWEGLSSHQTECPNINRNSTGLNQSHVKSRFTYQRRGNSEAHLSDVVKFSRARENSRVASLVNDLLLNRVYPWIRDAYLSKETTIIQPNELELYVYDSLFIRYNATEANLDAAIGERAGAGQPLHRDLGYVSVNIMLNSHLEFDGGGTFFENQLRSVTSERKRPESIDEAAVDISPLKPLGVGHALAHYSSDRHAGAATFRGVRDILVIFVAVAAAAREESEHDGAASMVTTRRAPTWERAARLKAASRRYCSKCASIVDHLACRMLHHRLAIRQVPKDGEAWHYLGMALLELYEALQNPEIVDSDLDSIGGKDVLELSIECFDEATRHTPYDGRLYNNLGIALERLLSESRDGRSPSEKCAIDKRIKQAYKTSFAVHSVCEKIGCDVGADFERTILNYGLYLSKQDDFEGAIRILSQIESRAASSFGEESAVNSRNMHTEDSRQKVIQDAKGLLLFCADQIK
ncbi:hypothetical protein ACHAXS_014022 [Conticribra weissflogii]